MGIPPPPPAATGSWNREWLETSVMNYIMLGQHKVFSSKSGIAIVPTIWSPSWERLLCAAPSRQFTIPGKRLVLLTPWQTLCTVNNEPPPAM